MTIAVRKTTEGELQLDGVALRKMRLKAGLTRQDLQKISGLGLGLIQRIEKGEDVAVSQLRTYVQGVGFDLKIEACNFGQQAFSVGNSQTKDASFGGNQPTFGFLNETGQNNRRDVVLSIKPQYSHKILEGSKIVELRRRFSSTLAEGAKAFIYSTTPDRALIGEATILSILRWPVVDIWREFKSDAQIEKVDFDRYYRDITEGVAICFDGAVSYQRPLTLFELRQDFGFVPPQSFMYASQEFQRVLTSESLELSGRH